MNGIFWPLCVSYSEVCFLGCGSLHALPVAPALCFPVVFWGTNSRTVHRSQESSGICAGCRGSIALGNLCCFLTELIWQLFAIAETENPIGPRAISLKALAGCLFYRSFPTDKCILRWVTEFIFNPRVKLARQLPSCKFFKSNCWRTLNQMLWKNPSVYNCFYNPDCDAVTREAFILLGLVFSESVLPGTPFGLGLCLTLLHYFPFSSCYPIMRTEN